MSQENLITADTNILYQFNYGILFHWLHFSQLYWYITHHSINKRKTFKSFLIVTVNVFLVCSEEDSGRENDKVRKYGHMSKGEIHYKVKSHHNSSGCVATLGAFIGLF